MATYGFSEGDAKRIGRVVRRVERGPEQIRLGGAVNARGAPGVTLIIGKPSTAAWSKGDSAAVTIYSGQPGSEASAMTMMAHNYFANIDASVSTASARWVGLANNGFGWCVIAAECD